MIGFLAQFHCNTVPKAVKKGSAEVAVPLVSLSESRYSLHSIGYARRESFREFTFRCAEKAEEEEQARWQNK